MEDGLALCGVAAGTPRCLYVLWWKASVDQTGLSSTSDISWTRLRFWRPSESLELVVMCRSFLLDHFSCCTQRREMHDVPPSDRRSFD